MDPITAFKTALADQIAGRLGQAESGYRAITAHEDHLPSLHNLGVILEATDRFEEAGEFYRRAARAAPDSPKRQLALANHYRMSRQFAEAEPVYRRGLALEPDNQDAAFELSMVLLALGRYPEGWIWHEARESRRRFLRQNLNFPEWKGEPLVGKSLFVWREQGFGDQIMMARFLPLLGASRITYAGPAELRRLFEPLAVTFMDARPDRNDVPRHDYWSLSGSLPKGLGVTADTVPATPYLFGSPAPTNARIGVVWRGEPANANDVHRSLPDHMAAPLLALPGAISLDPLNTGARDFQATADIIAGLDLVITVDTAVAHLAGAMGRPVWVMLAKHAIDWQWPREGKSAWYPSARLFTQPTAGDWGSVVETVTREAERMLAGAS